MTRCGLYTYVMFSLCLYFIGLNRITSTTKTRHTDVQTRACVSKVFRNASSLAMLHSAARLWAIPVSKFFRKLKLFYAVKFINALLVLYCDKQHRYHLYWLLNDWTKYYAFSVQTGFGSTMRKRMSSTARLWQETDDIKKAEFQKLADQTSRPALDSLSASQCKAYIKEQCANITSIVS